jgi:hypothetical protein
VLGFEALAALPLSVLPAIVVAVEDPGGSGPTFWMPEPLAWRVPDEEIIFLRRKTSSKAGV